MQKSLLSLAFPILIGISGLSMAGLAQQAAITIPNYTMGNMLAAVRIPNNFNAPPIIIGEVNEGGQLLFKWPVNLPAELNDAAEALNYAIRTGNCEPDETKGEILENKAARHVLFTSILLINPETKEVKSELKAASNDSLQAWLHKPDETICATGTYAYLLYAYDDNALHAACQYQSWTTNEDGGEITLNYTSTSNLKVSKGFQFVVYNIKEVHPFAGTQPKWQEVVTTAILPSNTYLKMQQ